MYQCLSLYYTIRQDKGIFVCPEGFSRPLLQSCTGTKLHDNADHRVLLTGTDRPVQFHHGYVSSTASTKYEPPIDDSKAVPFSQQFRIVTNCQLAKHYRLPVDDFLSFRQLHTLKCIFRRSYQYGSHNSPNKPPTIKVLL